MTMPTMTGAVTLSMPSLVAVEVRKVLVEGYASLRHDSHATPDWHMQMLRVIEDVSDQLKEGGDRG